MKVCLISEGCYPTIRGGLSEWAHLLMKTLKDIEFDVLSIAFSENDKPVYEQLPNVANMYIKSYVTGSRGKTPARPVPSSAVVRLVDLVENAFYGKPLDFDKIFELRETYLPHQTWLKSRGYWDFVLGTYRKNYADAPFVEYFWVMYGLGTMLINIINLAEQIPKADMYHCLSTGFAGFIGSMAKAMYRKPVLLTEQGLYLNERHTELARKNVSESYRQQVIRFSECLVKTSYKYADVIVPPCHSHIKVETQLGADPNKITVIRNGIECENFPPGYKNGSSPRLMVGCFARVVPVKGITTLIRAAKLARARCDVDFVVVGETLQDREYYQQCEALVAELGLKDHFRFTGHTNPVEWYHRVDVFTLSSTSEGVPYALLEAMSCGLPSVCTAVGGVPEIIAEGVGYVVPPEDPRQLADRICELLENRELRKKLGQHAIKVANERYTLREMAGNFRNIYEGLIDGCRRI